MLKGKKTRRILASFFLLVILNNLLFPTVAWALTSGPNSPEASSFEPIDTTDMVNLISGDFVYNLPLLEVPGPAGGYPINMSYHAGIMPNEDASWVGLGWSLNTGAINRNVNGYADDHNGLNSTSRSWWSGGETHTISAGVSYGIANSPLSVSAGVSVSKDTYQGIGIGHSFGFSFNPLGKNGDKGPLGLSANLNHDGYGNFYSSLGLGAGAPIGASGINLGVSVGLSTNFDKVGGFISGGISTQGYSIASASNGIGKERNSRNISIGGSSINSSKSGIVSQDSWGISIPIPMPVPGLFVDLGYRYNRYWSDEIDTVSTVGTLYTPSYAGNQNFDKQAFDSYNLHDLTSQVFKEPDARKVNGLMFPAYDNYSVNAQGLSGVIRPYRFKSYLYAQNVKNKDDVYDLKNYSIGSNNGFADYSGNVGFRFVSNFSSAYALDGGNFTVSSSSSSSPLSYSTPVNEEKYGYFKSGKLAGSKHIEWFTNEEISATNPISGKLIKCDSYTKGFNRNSQFLGGFEFSEKIMDFKPTPGSGGYDKQIGGFAITSESGVTYHYALPVYSRNEWFVTKNIDETNGKLGSELRKPYSYAYTWLLTAVTGPDYVDRGVIGELDEDDWGYWVRFEYGKWNNYYGWRTPTEGFEEDIDQNFRNYSFGEKEVYYLNAVKTATHTALFVKEMRADGKGVVDKETGAYYFNEAYLNCMAFCTSPVTGICDNTNPDYSCAQCKDNCKNNSSSYTNYTLPASSMRLNKIILVSNADLENASFENIERLGGSISPFYSSFYSRSARNYNDNNLIHHVVDEKDLVGISDELRNITLREIDFTYDYSLAPNTSNSFDLDGSIYLDRNVDPSSKIASKEGKLTLKNVHFRGKKKVSSIPALSFNYELDFPSYFGASIDLIAISGYPRSYRVNLDGAPSGAIHEFQVGDIIRYKKVEIFGLKTFYAVVVKKTSNYLFVNPLNSENEGRPFHSGGALFLSKTKNPPYNKDAYDIWGMFKSDYYDYEDINNANLEHYTSNISSKSTDVWSLRTVTTPTGSKLNIDYESDSYNNPILVQPSILTVKSVIKGSNGTIKVNFYGSTVSAQEIFEGNDKTDFVLQLLLCNRIKTEYWNFGAPSTAYKFSSNISTLNVKSEDVVLNSDNSILVSNSQIFSLLFPTNLTTITSGTIPSGYPDIPSNSWEETYYNTPDVVGGNLISKRRLGYQGGGIRVKSISIETGQDKEIIKYEYGNSEESFGYTSYNPSFIDIAEFNYPNVRYYTDQANKDMAKIEEAKYRDKLNEKFSNLLKIASEVPAPGVLYQKVKVSRETEDQFGRRKVPGSTQYEFQVFDEDMVKVITENPYDVQRTDHSPSGLKTVRLNHRKITVKNFTSRIGNLKRVTTFDGKDQKMTETINHYLHDGLADYDYKGYEDKVWEPWLNGQGTIQEVFINGRVARQKDNAVHLFGVISRREEYPAIVTGQTSIDYRTGLKSTSQNLAFDYITGLPLEVLSTDSQGNKFVTITKPAYTVYSAMGLKLANSNNKHMLSQTAAQYIYRVNDNYIQSGNTNDVLEVVSGSAQTWSPQIQNIGGTGGGWKKHRSYFYKGTNADINGKMSYSSNVQFNQWGFSMVNGAYPSQTGWEMSSVVLLTDPYSHVLSVQDINGNISSSKTNSKFTQIYATSVNAQYEQIAFSGAEDDLIGGYFGGRVRNLNGVISSARAHTGKYSLLVPANSVGFNYSINPAGLHRSIPNGTSYRASVWVNAANNAIPNARIICRINNSDFFTSNAPIVSKKVGNWYLLETIIPPFNSNFSSYEVLVRNLDTQSIYMDDFRLHPVDAPMTSYVYDQFTGELSYILDNNNLYTYFKYNAFGQLEEIHKESFQYGVKKVSEFDINYGRDQQLMPLTANTVVSSGCMLTSVSGGQAPYQYIWYSRALHTTDWGTPIYSETINETTSCYSFSSTCLQWRCEVKDKLGNSVSSIGANCN